MQESGAKAGIRAAGSTVSLCGHEFPETMEVCPVCMLRQGLGGGFESGEPPASENTVKLTALEQLAQRFEHYELLTGEDGKSVESARGAMGVTTTGSEDESGVIQ